MKNKDIDARNIIIHILLKIIGRLLGFSDVAILYWIKQFGKNNLNLKK